MNAREYQTSVKNRMKKFNEQIEAEILLAAQIAQEREDKSLQEMEEKYCT